MAPASSSRNARRWFKRHLADSRTEWRRLVSCVLMLACWSAAPRAQAPSPAATTGDASNDGSAAGSEAGADGAEDDVPRRLLGIIPNYRTARRDEVDSVLTPRAKFRLASDDAFDRGTFVLAGLFGAQADLTVSDPSFGRGAWGYGRYYAAALADQIAGDFMSEAVFPVMLHHDPRYFRQGSGSVWARTGHALGQLVRTRTDSGGNALNLSELGGNAAAVAISTAYYTDDRRVSLYLTHWTFQVATDAASNLLKEFGPDLNRALAHNRGADHPSHTSQ